MGNGAAFFAPEGVRWLVEAASVVLIGPGGEKRLSLAYPSAAVWDLLVRGYDEAAARAMLELIADLAPDQSESLVESCLEAWLREGWLARRGGAG